MYKLRKPFSLLTISLLTLTACIDSSNHKGDLGGVAVDLPKNLVHLVEYNDDETGWGTYDSKISSFGFYIRYTNKTIFDEKNRKMKKTYDTEKLLPNNPWVSVGINSGDEYYGAGGIHRIGDGHIHAYSRYKNIAPFRNYEILEQKQYGLEVYAPPGINPKTGQPYREDVDAADVFIKRNAQGEIITFIQCSNRNLENYATFPVERPPCTHYFDLEPDMALDVYASYSRHNLADWQQIEATAKQAILNFRKI